MWIWVAFSWDAAWLLRFRGEFAASHDVRASPLVLLLVVAPVLAAAGEPASYRASSERPVPPFPSGGGLAEVELWLPHETGAGWPDEPRRALEERIAREWPAHLSYGAVQTGVGVWLDYPLVTRRRGTHVVVPVIEDDVMPVTGRLDLRAAGAGPRRVVLLIDASSSTNQRTRFTNADGSVERVSVLEAELRALDHLLQQLEGDPLELGVVAFGESTWPIARPGDSRATVREGLETFRRERPRGEGRTDTVCALWTAIDMLDETPRGVSREIVLLSDGDTPHSGRFTDCSRGSRKHRAACEARRNQTVCPAGDRIRRQDGRSDVRQLARLGRRVRRKVRVSPVVFEADRSARPYRVLAEDTGGEFVQLASVQGIEVALPPLVAGRIRGVFAKNPAIGAESDNLLTEDVSTFRGSVPLVPGANDVELRVESDRGPAAFFRFRVYSEPGYLDRYLASLRERNRELEARSEAVLSELRAERARPRARSVEVLPE